MTGPHPSHRTRTSVDASSYDTICEDCNRTDTLGGWGDLAEPCPSPRPAPPEPSPSEVRMRRRGWRPYAELSADDRAEVDSHELSLNQRTRDARHRVLWYVIDPFGRVQVHDPKRGEP